MPKSINRTKAALMGAALTVALVAVAIAASSPLSRSTTVDATSAQAPTIAVFLVLVGLGIVLVGALGAVAWSGRRRKDDPPEPEPTRFELPWYWKLIAVLVLFALGAALVAAAVAGARSGASAQQLRGGLSGSAPLQLASPTRAAGGFALPAWLPWTALGIVALAITAGVSMLWLTRPRPSTDADDAGATSAAVDAAIGALDAGSDPRHAVIAAYAAMQATLGRHGVVRSPAEAPREYLRRVLVERGATEREAATLTGLFEEARYSTHPITERVREVALSALRSLRRRLPAEGAE
jgi:uncharacterized membrane protein YidH (DUF202 family)